MLAVRLVLSKAAREILDTTTGKGCPTTEDSLEVEIDYDSTQIEEQSPDPVSLDRVGRVGILLS